MTKLGWCTAVSVSLLLSGGGVMAAPIYKLTLLPPLPGVSGSQRTRAYGINEAGQIVGTSIARQNMLESDHLALWSRSGEVQDLGQREVLGSMSINDQGEITISSGLLWSAAEGFRSAGMTPLDINNSSVVAGSAEFDRLQHAVYRTPDAVIHDLGVPTGSLESIATAINQNGDIAGYTTGAGHNHAYLWPGGGAPVDLGTLAGGLGQSSANDINDNGQVVGTSDMEFACCGFFSIAFIWTREGAELKVTRSFTFDPHGCSIARMPRIARKAPGGLVYHVLNRANGRLRLFKKEEDYLAFEQVLLEAEQRVPVRILGWCLMPNHWHLVLWPERDGQLTGFLRWLTLTHAQRWKHAHAAVGHGHLYQGRFKSFPIEQAGHLLRVLRYVERNPLRAGRVKQAQQWRWGSCFVRGSRSHELYPLLSDWPVSRPRDWGDLVNRPQTAEEEEAMAEHIRRNRPLGSEAWVKRTARALKLEQSLRPRGRPVGWRKEPQQGKAT